MINEKKFDASITLENGLWFRINSDLLRESKTDGASSLLDKISGETVSSMCAVIGVLEKPSLIASWVARAPFFIRKRHHFLMGLGKNKARLMLSTLFIEDQGICEGFKEAFVEILRGIMIPPEEAMRLNILGDSSNPDLQQALNLLHSAVDSMYSIPYSVLWGHTAFELNRLNNAYSRDNKDVVKACGIPIPLSKFISGRQSDVLMNLRMENFRVLVVVARYFGIPKERFRQFVKLMVVAVTSDILGSELDK